LMSEPTLLCDVLIIERTAEYLGVVPGKLRSSLANTKATAGFSSSDRA
jgi:hypothetical protein